jgi:hypothetical protein
LTTTLVLLVTGFVAGAVNSVAGGGSLITFPTLLALGYPAVQANVTNTVGVLPGNLGGTAAFRHELAGQRDRLIRCGLAGGAGAAAGSVLLLHTPEAAFRRTVPALILLAAVLILVQPLVSDRLRRRQRARTLERRDAVARSQGSAWAAPLAVGVIAVYGGYFGAAVGVMLIAALGTLVADSLVRVNALKTAMQLAVNGVSAVIFAAVASVAWGAAVTLALASGAGGFAGGRVARRLPETWLRVAIVAVGVAAAITVAVRG